MERLEDAETAARRARPRRRRAGQRPGRGRAARDAAFAEHRRRAPRRRRPARRARRPRWPTDLLALYEKLRARTGGVGAAALRQRRCEGCRLELNSAELRPAARAAADEVLRCEECGRILVRTAESGLWARRVSSSRPTAARAATRGRPPTARVVRDADTGEVLAERGRAHRRRDQQRRRVQRADRRAARRRARSTRTPRSRCGWTPSSWSSRCPAAGRSSTRTCSRSRCRRSTVVARRQVTYTWVPREQNKHADRLANEAMDDGRSAGCPGGAVTSTPRPPCRRRPGARRSGAAERPAGPAAAGEVTRPPTAGPDVGRATTWCCSGTA